MSGVPGWKWRWARRATQSLAVVAILAAPLLGGWQRLDADALASFESPAIGLPPAIRGELPAGRAPGLARRANQLLGGGLGVEYLSVPIIDPVAGIAASLGARPGLRMLVALLLPVALAVVAGRVFCGWFCPFGLLSRSIDRTLALVRRRPPLALPKGRWLRWVLLAATALAALTGTHALLYLTLPHFLVQHSIYSVWLLGGGGALLGVLVGLLLAGLLFGPTAYCASLCPTGALLSLFGRLRRVRVAIGAPGACGAHCGLCTDACWLQLDPASGDPGPDCDVCTRCFASCPRTNLVVRAGDPAPRSLVPLVLLGALLAPAILPSEAAARERKPTLLLEVEREHSGVTLGLAIVDLTGVKVGIDAPERLEGVEVSVVLARGERGGADERGLLPARDVYSGPLRLQLVDAEGGELAERRFAAPNAPVSAPRRTLYRWRPGVALDPGDLVVVGAVAGWLESTTPFTIPRAGVSIAPMRFIAVALAAGLCFAGLLSLAYALPARPAGAPQPRR